jgi:cytoskeletal protein CcmA (bactofilin family)
MLFKREKLDRSDVELEQTMTEPPLRPAPASHTAAPPPETKAAVEPAPVPPPQAAPAPAPTPTPTPAGKGSILGESLRFKGDLVADEDLVIQGQVEGSILHTRSLTIGAQGRLHGEIRARRIAVQGTVDGNLYALESVALNSGCTVRGDVFAPKVAIDEGARLSGRIDMDNAPTVPTVNLPTPSAMESAEREVSAEEVSELLSGARTRRVPKSA